MMHTEPTTSVRIRFSGNTETDTFHMSIKERDRLHSDWNSYLSGLGTRGGEYASQDGGHSVMISLNFTQIAYTEPGKLY